MKNRIIIGIAVFLALIAAIFLFNMKKNTGSAGGAQQSANVSLQELLNKAKDSENKGDIEQTKNAYQELINNFPSSNEMTIWQKKTEDLNMKIMFSPEISGSKSTLYEIQPGDTLVKIAKKFNSTPELVMKINKLTSDKIFPGKKIKVWTAVLSILVDKSQNILMLKSDEEIIKTYIVSTGLNNSTPVGTFKIMTKLANPTWFKTGAVVPAGSSENQLGTRWLGFDLAGYGIHGTIDPKNLGKQITQGCVRMGNADVEELFMIVPQGTEVTVID